MSINFFGYDLSRVGRQVFTPSRIHRQLEQVRVQYNM